jgi:hypothetical protein
MDHDEPNDAWHNYVWSDLYFQDFLYYACIQTAHCMTQHTLLYPSHDYVLEWLLVGRSFDHDNTHTPNTAEESAMQYASTIGQQLLACVEVLES